MGVITYLIRMNINRVFYRCPHCLVRLPSPTPKVLTVCAHCGSKTDSIQKTEQVP